jgi:hypothetical protein
MLSGERQGTQLLGGACPFPTHDVGPQIVKAAHATGCYATMCRATVPTFGHQYEPAALFVEALFSWRVFATPRTMPALQNTPRVVSMHLTRRASGPAYARTPLAGKWAEHWPDDLERLKRDRFSSEDQLTLGLFCGPDATIFETARRLHLRTLTEFLRPIGRRLDETGH